MSNSDKNVDLPKSVRRRALVPKEDCPMALAAEIIGDRWTLLILREAFYGVQRYDDMLADLGAPRSMLTDRLGKLIKRGLITRRPYQEPGDRKRYAYVLTSMGHDLALTLIALTQWGEDNILGGKAPVRVTDRNTGKRLQVKLVNETDDVVNVSSAMLSKRS